MTLSAFEQTSDLAAVRSTQESVYSLSTRSSLMHPPRVLYVQTRSVIHQQNSPSRRSFAAYAGAHDQLYQDLGWLL